MLAVVPAMPRYIELETSRKCNRTCAWCPNGLYSRHDQTLMEWELFIRIVAELSELEYAGWLAFHNYNEPLLNPRLMEEIEHIRQHLPQAKPAIYTNGDVLKRDRLDDLIALGVQYVRVTRYPHTADIEPTYEALRHWMKQAGILDYCDWTYGTLRQGLGVTYRDESRGLLIEIIGPRISTYNDRGGTALIPTIPAPRTEPCLMTTTSASIDYRGNLKMCCNVVPGTDPDHDQYVVGNLATSTFAQLWGSDQMQAWRKSHGIADWGLSPACILCTQALPETRRS